MVRYLLITLAIICFAFHLPDNTTDKLVMKAAENQLPIYIAKIPPGHETEYGFTDKDDFENCSVAKPYRMITFNQEFYSAPLADNRNYLDIKNEWRVPVTLKGEHRVLLTVDGNSGNYKVSAMAGAELAKELEYKAASMSDDDQFYILRVYPLSADFFVSEHENSFVDAQFIPLASAHKAIPAIGDNKKSFTLDEVQQLVKKAVDAKYVPRDTPKKKPAKKRSKK